MAALDFPASPATNQLFSAINGVIYRWNGTLWLAVGSVSPSPGGDFAATASGAALSPGAAWATTLWPTVTLGNAGLWYNTTTGRFTPPAGRYFIRAAYSGYSSASGILNQIRMRKNGVAIPNADSSQSSGAANQWCQVGVDQLVDATGADYFDIQTQGTVPNSGCYGWFYAFPLSGVKGPPGDPGVVPAADPGCKTTFLAAQTSLATTNVNLIGTGLIGLANQKWRISAYIGINNNPANWSYCDIAVTAGGVVGGATSIANGAVYNSVAGATANAFMESIETLIAPSTFTLRGNSPTAAVAQSGRATAITAERLT